MHGNTALHGIESAASRRYQCDNDTYPGQNFPLRCKFARVLVDVPGSGEGNYRWDAQGRLRICRVYKNNY